MALLMSPSRLGAEVGGGAGPTQSELRSSAEREDWLMTNKDYAGNRFAYLDQITRANAAKLELVCSWQSGVTGAAAQSTPVVYHGIMYVSVADTTAALDARTCAEKWRYTWKPVGNELSNPNRGVAIADGLVVRGTGDGYLIALDSGTGTLRWQRQLVGADQSYYLSMPAMIFDGLVIYGTAGADWGGRGWIGAFRLRDGSPVWTFSVIPDPASEAAASWNDPKALAHGGGSFWTPVAVDAAAGILYAAAGNPAPDFYGAVREGADLYTDSVIALDVRSGKLLWYDQVVPHDVHDWDLDQVSPLFALTRDGERHDVMTVSGKDGVLHLFDRDSHKELWSTSITTRENVSVAASFGSPVHVCPGLLGGEEWSTAAYDGSRKTLYVPAVDWCGTLNVFQQAPVFASEQHYYGGSMTQDPVAAANGWLTALDATAGTARWRFHAASPMLANVVATAGAVIFTGTMAGDFLALDSDTGLVLYRHALGASVAGGVITYALSGTQYVAVESGYVSKFFGGSGTSPEYSLFALASH